MRRFVLNLQLKDGDWPSTTDLHGLPCLLAPIFSHCIQTWEFVSLSHFLPRLQTCSARRCHIISLYLLPASLGSGSLWDPWSSRFMSSRVWSSTHPWWSSLLVTWIDWRGGARTGACRSLPHGLTPPPLVYLWACTLKYPWKESTWLWDLNDSCVTLKIFINGEIFLVLKRHAWRWLTTLVYLFLFL